MTTETPVVGDTPGDVRFRSLGVARLALPLPFVEAGNTVSVYAIENPDGSLTLFDTGLATEPSRQALERGLAELGRKVEDVRRIIVSHGHIDHYGAARFIRDRSGAQVLVHPADADKVSGHGARETLLEYAGYLARLGVPGEAIARIRDTHRSHRHLAEPLDEIEPLVPGQGFRFRHFTATILPMPGHTPGLVCLHVPEHRFVLTADHLLAHISPNPLLELGPGGEAGKFQALVTYLESARRLGELDLEWILPGHGAPFTGHRAVLESLRVFYEKRQAKMLRALASRPLTPYELVALVFRQGANLDLFLMLSEIVGNLEALEARGAVARIVGEVPYRYGVVTP
ncbi:MAG: MBL fold metallo-hydrolase [Deltaproteobacteria bacterium]|nr:MBL fold metallo-hydrolase [Deltaproteobacteria bacterium]